MGTADGGRGVRCGVSIGKCDGLAGVFGSGLRTDESLLDLPSGDSRVEQVGQDV